MSGEGLPGDHITEQTTIGAPLTTIITPSASVMTAAPATSAQEVQTGLTKQGQRDINRLWEATQTGMAVLTLLLLGIIYIIQYVQGVVEPHAPQILESVLLVIVTMYFTRTNHTKVGGTGEKEGER